MICCNYLKILANFLVIGANLFEGDYIRHAIYVRCVR